LHELQRLWVSLLREPWSSLVLVPTHRGLPVRSIAAPLVDIAHALAGRPVRLVHAEDISLSESARLAADLRDAEASGSRIVATLDAPEANDGTLPLITAAEATVLVVRVGESALSAGRDIIALARRERVLGAVAA
jgi:hypothetical protein